MPVFAPVSHRAQGSGARAAKVKLQADTKVRWCGVCAVCIVRVMDVFIYQKLCCVVLCAACTRLLLVLGSAPLRCVAAAITGATVPSLCSQACT